MLEILSQNPYRVKTPPLEIHVGDDFVIGSGGCNIRLNNADILSNHLKTKVSQLEPSLQWKHADSDCVFDGCGCNDDIPCIESNIHGKPIGCTICDVLNVPGWFWLYNTFRLRCMWLPTSSLYKCLMITIPSPSCPTWKTRININKTGRIYFLECKKYFW